MSSESVQFRTRYIQLSRYGFKSIDPQNDECFRSIFVFCAALKPHRSFKDVSPGGNSSFQFIASKLIYQKLKFLNPHEVSETLLTSLLKEVNGEMIQLGEVKDQALEGSAIVMILKPKSEDRLKFELLIAGLGDSKVFEISSSKLNLIFSDPNNNRSSDQVNPVEHIKNQKNILGRSSHINVFTQTLHLKTLNPLLIATWGFISQVSEWQMMKMGLKPQWIHSCFTKAQLSKMNFETSVQFATIHPEPLHLIETMPQKKGTKRDVKRFEIPFAAFVTTCLVLSALPFLFVEQVPKKNIEALQQEIKTHEQRLFQLKKSLSDLQEEDSAPKSPPHENQIKLLIPKYLPPFHSNSS